MAGIQITNQTVTGTLPDGRTFSTTRGEDGKAKITVDTNEQELSQLMPQAPGKSFGANFLEQNPEAPNAQDYAMPPGAAQSAPQAPGTPATTTPALESQPQIAQEMEVTKANPTSKASQKKVLAGVEEEQAGAKALSEVQSGAAKEQEAILRETQAFADKAIAEEAEREKLRTQELESIRGNLASQIDEIRNFKLDPSRFYKNAGTIGQISAAIAVGLGAVGNALSGRNGNDALDIINRAIDRDLEAQKIDFEAKRTGASQTESLYARMMAQFNDERLAKSAAKAAGLESAKLRLDVAAAKSRSPEVQANYQMQAGKFQQEIGKVMGEFDKAAQDKVTIKSQMKPKSPGEFIEAAGKIQSQINGDKQLQDHMAGIETARQMQGFIKSGLPGLALVSLISTGLKQGSFGGEMQQIAVRYGVENFTEEAIQRLLGGPKGAVFAREAMGALQSINQARQTILGPKLDLITAQARQIGAPLESFVPGGRSMLSEKASKDKRVK